MAAILRPQTATSNPSGNSPARALAAVGSFADSVRKEQAEFRLRVEALRIPEAAEAAPVPQTRERRNSFS